MFHITEDNRKWWVLLAVSGCISMIFLDVTVLPVALPTIQHQLNLSELGLQWVINAYTLTLTVLLLAGGKLSDLMGLRRAFCLGLLLFTIASLCATVSFSQWWLIASRVLQGVGGALLLPSTQAILTASFPPKERGKAMGLYVSIGAFFLSMGPLLGGAFSQYLSWRYVFVINLPVAALSFWLALLCIPRFEKKKESFDFIGFFTLSIGVTALIVALMQAQSWGWKSPLILSLFAIGLLSITALVMADRKISHPLVDFRLFQDKTLSVCVSLTFCIQMLIMVTVFWAIYLQTILGYSPAQAGVLSFLGNCPVLFAAPIAGLLVDRFGPRLPIACGFSFILFAIIWFLLFPTPNTFPLLLPIMIPLGIGIPMALTPSYVTLMNRAPIHQRGMIAGTNAALRQFAATLGMALFGTLFYTTQGSHLSHFLQSHSATQYLSAHTFDGLLARAPHAVQALDALPKESALLVLEGDRLATISAFSAINLLAASLAAAGLLLGICFLNACSSQERTGSLKQE
jgi:EmrB/QacA subfamily drug resistance transporter